MGGTTILLVLMAALVPCLGSTTGTYSVSYDGTRGGNSAGQDCVFPFVYKGISYTECTTKDFGRKSWCATTGNFDNDEKWANCKVTIKANRTRFGNAGKSTCIFNFLYNGVSYDRCIVEGWHVDRPWCATSPDYNRDKRWAECVCYQKVKTTGGNAGGANCNFPFYYRGVHFHGCTSWDNNNVGWCATTAVYEEDEQWGNCLIETVKEGSSTACPNGENFDKATDTNSVDGTGQANATSVAACEEVCLKDAECAGFDYDNNPGISTRCYTHKNATFEPKLTGSTGVDQYTKKACASMGTEGGAMETESGKPVLVKGGNAGPGARCNFPFLFRGYQMTSCTSQGWYTAWCGTTSNYDKDRTWGQCSNVPMD